MYKIFIIFSILTFLIISCDDAKDYVTVKKTETIKERNMLKKFENKEKEGKKKRSIKVLTNKNEEIYIEPENIEHYKNNLKSKNIEKIDNTLSTLKSFEKDMKMGKAGNRLVNGKNSNNSASYYQVVKNIFKMKINDYIFRDLKIDSDGDKPDFKTLSFKYQNGNSYVLFELAEKDPQYLEAVNKKQKDFFRKSFQINTISIELSINTRFKLINGVFDFDKYSWIITSEGINNSETILEIIKSINFKLFTSLRIKYE